MGYSDPAGRIRSERRIFNGSLIRLDVPCDSHHCRYLWLCWNCRDLSLDCAGSFCPVPRFFPCFLAYGKTASDKLSGNLNLTSIGIKAGRRPAAGLFFPQDVLFQQDQRAGYTGEKAAVCIAWRQTIISHCLNFANASGLRVRS